MASQFALPSRPDFFKTVRIMKTTTLPSRNLMNRSPLRAFLLIPLVLACFALLPQARATCQQGCLTNSNTVLGDDALFSNTTGDANTATGFHALLSSTTGANNTANGHNALLNNRAGNGNTASGVNALSANINGDKNT